MNVRQRHEELTSLRANHPAWRLLHADHAPLVLGFLTSAFLEPNVRSMPGPELAEALDDYLVALRSPGNDDYPKSAEAYLGDWADPRRGWLRRFYPTGSDVPHFAPTAAVESAVAFVRGLSGREFVGTASRLLTVRDLLRQIAAGAAADPQVRLAALERQRVEIEAQIDAVRAGSDATLDDTAIRERYEQATETAQSLLADLRGVEENLRALDRQVRRLATTWEGPRGAFLDAVFGSTHEIGASDQGRSWLAMWEHLLSSRQREEMTELLTAVHEVLALDGRRADLDTLLRHDLFVAAEATQRVVASLSAQLRRFLDEQSWSEGRRIHSVIRFALTAALELRDGDVRDAGSEVPALGARISLPLERPLHTLRDGGTFDSTITAEDAVADGDALMELLALQHIDIRALREAVDHTVAAHGGHATLRQVVEEHPLTDGLAELIGYLQVGDDAAVVVADSTESVTWVDADNVVRTATLPVVLFSSTTAAPLLRVDAPVDEELVG